MPDPGVTRPDLCSIRAAAAQAEPAEAVRGGLSADGHPLVGDDPPAPRVSGIDRAIRLSTAVAVLAVAGIAAYVSYWHAYAVVRAHGETGITARLEPATIDGLVYASSMVVLYAARHRVPVTLPGPLAARAGHRRHPHGEHGPGLVPRSRRGGGRGLAGGQSRGLVRTLWSGSSAPPGRQTSGRRQSTCAMVRPTVLRRVLSQPWPLTASASEGASPTRQTWRGGPRARPPGGRPSPLAGSVTKRRPGPALSMTRRWRRTGSACRPAIRCRNAGSPRCSGAHPAAGREPGSPMHGKHRRPQTRRAPRPRLTP